MKTSPKEKGGAELLAKDPAILARKKNRLAKDAMVLPNHPLQLLRHRRKDSDASENPGSPKPSLMDLNFD